LRRPRGLRLLLLLGLLLGGPRRLLGRRGGRRALGFGFRLLVRHRVPWERGAPNSERYLRVKERRAGPPRPATTRLRTWCRGPGRRPRRGPPSPRPNRDTGPPH